MNSIFMTKYANLSTINKFNKYASKKIPLSLKRRVLRYKFIFKYSKIQSFKFKKSKKY